MSSVSVNCCLCHPESVHEVPVPSLCSGAGECVCELLRRLGSVPRELCWLSLGCCSCAQARGSRGLLSPGTARVLLSRRGVQLMASILGQNPRLCLLLFPSALKSKPQADDPGSDDCCQSTRASHVLYPLASLNALIEFLCLPVLPFLPQKQGRTEFSESGTIPSSFLWSLKQRSKQSSGPYMSVNCPALSVLGIQMSVLKGKKSSFLPW